MSNSDEPTITADGYRPDLPDWGAYVRWPHDDDHWIHPEDLPLASQLLPSRRVWRREKWDGKYYLLRYGRNSIRVQPSMWTRAPDVDLNVGQQVELLARHGKNDRGIYELHEIMLSTSQLAIEFFLRRGEMILERSFSRDDLRPLSVHYHLRSGFYKHAVPKSSISDDLDPLDVGDMLSD